MKRAMIALAAALLTSAHLGCCATHCDAPRCCKPFAGGAFGNWGCGGLYRGDWYSVPPDYCTHCVHYGNVTHAGYDASYDGGYHDEVTYHGGHEGGPIVPDGYQVIDDRAVTTPRVPTPAPAPPPVPARPTSRAKRPTRAY